MGEHRTLQTTIVLEVEGIFVAFVLAQLEIDVRKRLFKAFDDVFSLPQAFALQRPGKTAHTAGGAACGRREPSRSHCLVLTVCAVFVKEALFFVLDELEALAFRLGVTDGQVFQYLGHGFLSKPIS